MWFLYNEDVPDVKQTASCVTETMITTKPFFVWNAKSKAGICVHQNELETAEFSWFQKLGKFHNFMTKLEKTVHWMPHNNTSGRTDWNNIENILWIVNEPNSELNKSFGWFANGTLLLIHIKYQFNPFKSNPSADNKMKTEKKDQSNGL